MVGVFVNYTPSPEAQYPQAINEIYSAAKWVAEHGSEINVNGKKLAIMGNSVGGNMTAAVCLMAKERKSPEIKLAVMLWPIVDANFDSESYKLFGQDRFLTTAMMKWMFDAYTTNPKQRKEIYASPLEATVEQLKGLPPTLIQVAENDILRDGAEAYGRKLADAGVTATTVRYNGAIHDWGMLNGLAHIPQTKDLILHASAELKKYLN
jgi:acetyl esterase/lipase